MERKYFQLLGNISLKNCVVNRQLKNLISYKYEQRNFMPTKLQ